MEQLVLSGEESTSERAAVSVGDVTTAAVDNFGMCTAAGVTIDEGTLEICALGSGGSSSATVAKGTLASRVEAGAEMLPEGAALGGRTEGCMEAGEVAEWVGHGEEDIPFNASRHCGSSSSMDAEKSQFEIFTVTILPNLLMKLELWSIYNMQSEL